MLWRNSAHCEGVYVTGGIKIGGIGGGRGGGFVQHVVRWVGGGGVWADCGGGELGGGCGWGGGGLPYLFKLCDKLIVVACIKLMSVPGN